MSSERPLDGKVALVTGASRGIGRAIAEALSHEGAAVVVAYREQQGEAERVVAGILENDGCAISCPLEVTSRRSVQDALQQVHGEFGHIDILVNNAGLLQQKPFRKISDADWDRVLDVNLKGVFICTQEISKWFEKQGGGGAIVNITSVGGQTGGAKAPHYAAAKAGVISFTKSSARLLAPQGVRVNGVAPGFIRTDMFSDIARRQDEQQIRSGILLGEIGEARDVAEAVTYLASDRAKYVTGHILNVNGGLFLGAGS